MKKKTTVGHCKADSIDTYVGRGPGGRHMLETPVGKRGWLGNPYTTDEYSRQESINKFSEAFEKKIRSDKDFRDSVKQLKGDTLGCWCQKHDEEKPPCHAEVIAAYTNGLSERGEN
jgi:hypothetical protein